MFLTMRLYSTKIYLNKYIIYNLFFLIGNANNVFDNVGYGKMVSEQDIR